MRRRRRPPAIVVSTAVHPSQDAIADLVRQQQAGLRSHLRWLGASNDVADDLVQDTFVVALTQPPVERDPASTAAWLRTVARHLDDGPPKIG